jgi:hypothetical protein
MKTSSIKKLTHEDMDRRVAVVTSFVEALEAKVPRESDVDLATLRSTFDVYAAYEQAEDPEIVISVSESLGLWSKTVLTERGYSLNITSLKLALDHSALLRWLLAGNQPLPHPPPVRFSQPDHEMAVTGTCTAVEVWVFEGKPIVDQYGGWTLVEHLPATGTGSEVYILDHLHWGRWHFSKDPVERVPVWFGQRIPT